MAPLPRGTCIACAREVAMRTNGVTREHQHYRTGKKCPGSAKRSREEIDVGADPTTRERVLARTTPIVLLRAPGESS